MNIYRFSELTEDQLRELTIRRPDEDSEVKERVREICLAVKEKGDEAAQEFARKYDRLAPTNAKVSVESAIDAQSRVPADFLKALKTAARSITTFHLAQRCGITKIQTMPGVTCWREWKPIERVGFYVPAGSAPLPSTMLMLGIPALIAGCARIVVCSPPNDKGSVDPKILAAAQTIGISEIYALGGAQAIAAFAYGTESIPKVDKIFGPGNKFVAAAKRFVSTDPDGAAIDLPAGPSELLVIADKTADPRFVSADLLSQAEHDPDARVVLVTNNDLLADNVFRLMKQGLIDLPRSAIIREALEKSFILIVKTMEQAIDFVNSYAPEHLSIQAKGSQRIASQVRHAGSVFLGGYSPVTAGDYASGTNHTLPTAGAAKSFGGITVESFQKAVFYQRISKNGLKKLSPTLHAFASAEGLLAHGMAVSVRQESPK
ncbi:MAG: histidinol dehydrogenase [Ignavibacteriales bacterium]|nr:histidinol dehydrogenase [Ignavibacteriales bacterium]